MLRKKPTLTTKPDHNRIRQGPISADAFIAEVPGERPYPTAWAYCKQVLDCCQTCCQAHGGLSARRDRAGTLAQKVTTPGRRARAYGSEGCSPSRYETIQGRPAGKVGPA